VGWVRTDPEWPQDALLILLGTTIEHSDLPHIFERFYRRKGSTEGFGLELPICWELIERMGSNISLGSLEGPGTVAEAELPRYC
jgi:signal transduction histidine kinase